jgi:hypothetical protein
VGLEEGLAPAYQVAAPGLSQPRLSEEIKKSEATATNSRFVIKVPSTAPE